ncbi:MAG: tetratricopeptide repeat protein [Candidatus Omnitrophica bacterium]|nr:tetratricopeptide repeat protein [Candidatus Omnitrophota bacterium]
MRRARRCFENKEYGLALNEFSTAVLIDPNSGEAHLGRGKCEAKMSNLTAAIEEYSKAIECDPGLTNALKDRGVAYAKTGEFAKAEDDFEKAITLDPELKETVRKAVADLSARGVNIDAAFLKADTNKQQGFDDLQKGSYSEAIVNFNRALRLTPNDAALYYYRGKAHLSIDNRPEAIRDLKKALSSLPEDSPLRVDIVGMAVEHNLSLRSLFPAISRYLASLMPLLIAVGIFASIGANWPGYEALGAFITITALLAILGYKKHNLLPYIMAAICTAALIIHFSSDLPIGEETRSTLEAVLSIIISLLLSYKAVRSWWQTRTFSHGLAETMQRISPMHERSTLSGFRMHYNNRIAAFDGDGEGKDSFLDYAKDEIARVSREPIVFVGTSVMFTPAIESLIREAVAKKRRIQFLLSYPSDEIVGLREKYEGRPGGSIIADIENAADKLIALGVNPNDIRFFKEVPPMFMMLLPRYVLVNPYTMSGNGYEQPCFVYENIGMPDSPFHKYRMNNYEKVWGNKNTITFTQYRAASSSLLQDAARAVSDAGTDFSARAMALLKILPRGIEYETVKDALQDVVIRRNLSDGTDSSEWTAHAEAVMNRTEKAIFELLIHGAEGFKAPDAGNIRAQPTSEGEEGFIRRSLTVIRGHLVTLPIFIFSAIAIIVSIYPLVTKPFVGSSSFVAVILVCLCLPLYFMEEIHKNASKKLFEEMIETAEHMTHFNRASETSGFRMHDENRADAFLGREDDGAGFLRYVRSEIDKGEDGHIVFMGSSLIVGMREGRQPNPAASAEQNARRTRLGLELEKLIREAKEKKCKMQFLLVYPSHEIVGLREKYEGRQPGAILEDIEESVRCLEKIGIDPEDIRLYRETPPAFMVLLPRRDTVLINPYTLIGSGYEQPCFVYENIAADGSPYKKYFENNFTRVWTDDVTITLADYRASSESLIAGSRKELSDAPADVRERSRAALLSLPNGFVSGRGIEYAVLKDILRDLFINPAPFFGEKKEKIREEARKVMNEYEEKIFDLVIENSVMPAIEPAAAVQEAAPQVEQEAAPGNLRRALKLAGTFLTKVKDFIVEDKKESGGASRGGFTTLAVPAVLTVLAMGFGAAAKPEAGLVQRLNEILTSCGISPSPEVYVGLGVAAIVLTLLILRIGVNILKTIVQDIVNVIRRAIPWLLLGGIAVAVMVYTGVFTVENIKNVLDYIWQAVFAPGSKPTASSVLPQISTMLTLALFGAAVSTGEPADDGRIPVTDGRNEPVIQQALKRIADNLPALTKNRYAHKRLSQIHGYLSDPKLSILLWDITKLRADGSTVILPKEVLRKGVEYVARILVLAGVIGYVQPEEEAGQGLGENAIMDLVGKPDPQQEARALTDLTDFGSIARKQPAATKPAEKPDSKVTHVVSAETFAEWLMLYSEKHSYKVAGSLELFGVYLDPVFAASDLEAQTRLIEVLLNAFAITYNKRLGQSATSEGEWTHAAEQVPQELGRELFGYFMKSESRAAVGSKILAAVSRIHKERLNPHIRDTQIKAELSKVLQLNFKKIVPTISMPGRIIPALLAVATLFISGGAAWRDGPPDPEKYIGYFQDLLNQYGISQWVVIVVIIAAVLLAARYILKFLIEIHRMFLQELKHAIIVIGIPLAVIAAMYYSPLGEILAKLWKGMIEAYQRYSDGNKQAAAAVLASLVVVIAGSFTWAKTSAAKEEPVFVIGVPEDISARKEAALRESFKDRARIVKVRDAEALAVMSGDGQKVRGIFIDNAALDSGIDAKEIAAAMLATTYEGILVMSAIDEETRLEMAKLIKAMLPNIESMKAEDIFAFVQEMMAYPGFRKNMDKLRELTREHIGRLNASGMYNKPSIVRDAAAAGKKAGVVVTEKAALNNPTFAAGVREIMDAGGVMSLVYGKELNAQRAKQLLVEAGCSPEDIANIRLIEKTAGMTMDELEGIVAAGLPEGLAISNVAIVTAPGELSGDATNMKVLELKEVTVNGKPVLLAMNTEKVAYRMALMDELPANSMAIDGILGLYYNSDTKKFTYLPPMLPKNFGEEVETYRNAMLLLSSAA